MSQGENLLYAVQATDKVAKTSGFSSTITDSFTADSTGSVEDITYNNTDLYINQYQKCWQYSAFSSTVKSSVAFTPMVEGISVDRSGIVSKIQIQKTASKNTYTIQACRQN